MSEGEHGAGNASTARTTNASANSVGSALGEDEDEAEESREAEPVTLLKIDVVGVSFGEKRADEGTRGLRKVVG